MVFHDLTPNKSAPKTVKALLGLGSKFIVTPRKTTGCIDSSVKRLDRDFKLRVFFLCGEDSDYTFAKYDREQQSKLYIKSK